MSDWRDKVIVLLQAETADLKKLARIAGKDAKTFYRGTNLNGVDFRGQDARGMEFTDLEKAEILRDKKTRFDPEYEDLLRNTNDANVPDKKGWWQRTFRSGDYGEGANRADERRAKSPAGSARATKTRRYTKPEERLARRPIGRDAQELPRRDHHKLRGDEQTIADSPNARISVALERIKSTRSQEERLALLFDEMLTDRHVGMALLKRYKEPGHYASWVLEVTSSVLGGNRKLDQEEVEIGIQDIITIALREEYPMQRGRLLSQLKKRLASHPSLSKFLKSLS